MATVTIERLKAFGELGGDGSGSAADGERGQGYAWDCAALPRDYGTEAWEARPEVAAIRAAVFAALDRLEAETGVSARFRARQVLVKPNLVTVYHDMGLRRRSYPESTDPRVLDATVLWLQRFASEVVIVESSGRGAPTRGSFRVSGIDRLARLRGCGLLALDEQPVDRYILPKARFHREILVPRPFSAVVRGEAAYVSVPKMKTNLYTGVTLGFKNAMGAIPYNLRQRSHHYGIDRKLVEMLYLFKPDLVVIDGVVGAEGECPAPVDPVDSRMIVAGDHPVETDRVAMRLMGFDPASIELMRVADELGFGEPGGARVLANGFGPGGEASLGGASPVRFRPADWSLTSPRVRELFPEVLVLMGIDKGKPVPPEAGAGPEAGKAFVASMEAACRGGCVATTRFAFSMFEHEGARPRRPVAFVLGAGVEKDGARYWYDAGGKAYDAEAIRELPMRKAAIGSCARALAPYADRFVEGCMPMPNGPHMVLHDLGGAPCRVMSLRNRNLVPMLLAVIGAREARRRLLLERKRLDTPLRMEDGPVETRELSPDEAARDWVEWPLPPMEAEEMKRLLDFEDDVALVTFRGILVLRVKERALWTLKRILGVALVAALAALGVAASAGGQAVVGIGAAGWFGALAGLGLVRVAETPAALAAGRREAARRKRFWSSTSALRTILGTLASGYPWWAPKGLGVFD